MSICFNRLRIDRSFRLLVITFLLCSGMQAADTATAQVSAVVSAKTNAPAVYCLGDSITQADFEMYSWRYYLWKASVEAEQPLHFVGTLKENYQGKPEWPPVRDQTFPSAHDARWGWTTEQVALEMLEWLPVVEPDIALIHLATNDLLMGAPPQRAVDNIKLIVRAIQQDQPTVTIGIAQIIGSQSSRDFRPFNALLAKQAPGWSTETSRVATIDCFTGFDPDAMTYDGLHPNDDGEQWMAQRFWEFVQSQSSEAAAAAQD